MSANPNPKSKSYFAAIEAFGNGADTPRDFLERCLETVDALDGEIGAFVATDLDAARAAADAASERWKTATTLSLIDGMPVGIKDIMETHDMATEQGSPLFEGWRMGRDSAVVAALREAGAVIVGKTVTTEFAATHPRGTRNPWDRERTPGGSSSGSAASVAAGMLPAALGTQVIGSILRPASFCGCFGFKPSVGGINRGGSFDGFSQSCTGTLAATLAEAWTVAREMSARAGGDAGYVGLTGPRELPTARKPERVVMLETAGWADADDAAIAALADARERITSAGIEVSDRTTNPAVEAAEAAIAESRPLSMNINAWEGRWPLNTYARDMDADALSQSARDRLSTAESLSQEAYQGFLADRERIRGVYAALADHGEVCITLAASGAAPVGLGFTGDPTFLVPSSLLGAPAVSMPVMEADGMPLGLQLIGHTNHDTDLFAAAGGLLALFDAG